MWSRLCVETNTRGDRACGCAAFLIKYQPAGSNTSDVMQASHNLCKTLKNFTFQNRKLYFNHKGQSVVQEQDCLYLIWEIFNRHCLRWKLLSIGAKYRDPAASKHKGIGVGVGLGELVSAVGHKSTGWGAAGGALLVVAGALSGLGGCLAGSRWVFCHPG